MAIDIGSPAINRDTFSTGDYTYLCFDNPANESGTITDVEIWAYAKMYNCKVGVLYGSPCYFTSRDHEEIGSVNAGSKQSFSGLDISCETGDYIGVFFSTTGSGKIERASTGYAGVYQSSATGDKFGAGEQLYTVMSGDTLSLYGFSFVQVDVTVEPPAVSVSSEANVPSASLGLGLTAPLVLLDSQALIGSLSLDKVLSSPLVVISILAPEPEVVLPSITIDAPLVAIDAASLLPSFSIDRIVNSPLVSISSLGLSPMLCLDVSLSPPLVSLDVQSYITTFVLDRRFSVPLTAIDLAVLLPSTVIEMIIQAPLVQIDSESLVPTLSLDSIFTAPLTDIALVVLTPKAVFFIVPFHSLTLQLNDRSLTTALPARAITLKLRNEI